MKIILYYLQVTLMSIILVLPINILNAQMQKIYSPKPFISSNFGFFNNLIINDTVIIPENERAKDGSPDSVKISFFVSEGKNWKNIKYFDYPGYLWDDSFWWISYNNGRIVTLASNTPSGPTRVLRINKIKNDGAFFVEDSIVFPKGDGFKSELYNDWLILRYEIFDFTTYEITEFHQFYHKENGKWVKKNEYKFKKESCGLGYFSYSGIEINESFVAIESNGNNENGEHNGKVTIYKKSGNHWIDPQVIYQPDPYILNSYFGVHISLTPNSKFLAIGAKRDSTGSVAGRYYGCIYIYKNKENKWELYQKLSERNERWDFFGSSFNITEDELLVGLSGKYRSQDDPLVYSKGAIGYYKHKSGKWTKVSEIHPPVSDTMYGGFGRFTDREGETVVTGAYIDTTYYYEYGINSLVQANGAAYIFQIPARDTLEVEICQGESFEFNDTIITTSGHYVDTLPASYGVDSVVQLYVTVHEEESSSIDTVLCPGESIKIGEEMFSESGSYDVTLKSQYGCDSIVSLELDKSNLEEIDSIIKTDFGCKSGAIDLTVEGNNPPYGFLWDNGESGQILTGLEYGEYNVTITDNSDCKIERQYSVPDSIPFLIPNAFFPDGDEELNLLFKPYLAGEVELISTEIYNRWGEKVFSSEGKEYWDGRYKGEAMPPGVYLYKMEIKSPCGSKTETGQVVLLR